MAYGLIVGRHEVDNIRRAQHNVHPAAFLVPAGAGFLFILSFGVIAAPRVECPEPYIGVPDPLLELQFGFVLIGPGVGVADFPEFLDKLLSGGAVGKRFPDLILLS
jgi:hypothetical protein